MKSLFIPYELAVIAKEKGFNEPCLQFFKKINEGFYLSDNDGVNGIGLDVTYPFYNFDGIPLCDTNRIAAPLYQQIIDWFEVKHRIYFNRTVSGRNGLVSYTLLKMRSSAEDTTRSKDEGVELKFNEREAAQNKAIEEAFKLI